MLFAPSCSSRLRPVPLPDGAPGDGRTAVVGQIDRWIAGRAQPTERGALVVVDVEADDALPHRDDGPPRRRLGRTVERAMCADVAPGDVVGRVDAGRFVLLRRDLGAHESAADVAAALARTVERALIGRPEGLGVRITAGGTVLTGPALPPGREALGTVTTAMLRGKLLSDERVVVVVAVVR